MSCFEYEQGLKSALLDAGDQYKFQTWKEWVNKMPLPQGVKDQLPLVQDGLPLWDAIHNFVHQYIDLFYSSDSDVQKDKELQKYWRFEPMPGQTQKFAPQYEVPPLSKNKLIDQIAQCIFDATALHNFVGNVVEYTTDPAGACFQVRPGRDMCDLQQFIMVNSLVVTTATDMPMLTPRGEPGDDSWCEQMVPPCMPEALQIAMKTIYNNFQNTLMELSNDVKNRNDSGQRYHPFWHFDPRCMKRSVSV